MKIVFWITCAALAVVLCGVIFAAIAGATHGRDYVTNSAVAALVKPCLTIWLVGAGILWIYGFVILGRGWAQRSNARNLLLLFVLLILSTLVSPYFYWKRETL